MKSCDLSRDVQGVDRRTAVSLERNDTWTIWFHSRKKAYSKGNYVHSLRKGPQKSHLGFRAENFIVKYIYFFQKNKISVCNFLKKYLGGFYCFEQSWDRPLTRICVSCFLFLTFCYKYKFPKCWTVAFNFINLSIPTVQYSKSPHFTVRAYKRDRW